MAHVSVIILSALLPQHSYLSQAAGLPTLIILSALLPQHSYLSQAAGLSTLTSSFPTFAAVSPGMPSPRPHSKLLFQEASMITSIRVACLASELWIRSCCSVLFFDSNHLVFFMCPF